MGFRLDLDQVNVVAQLIEGNTLAVLEELFYSEEDFERNIQYINEILERFGHNFYSSNQHYSYDKKRRCSELISNLNYIYEYDELKGVLNEYWNDGNSYIDRIKVLKLLKSNIIFRDFEEILQGIHKLLGTSRINAIILPGCSDTEFNRYLTSEELLIDLVKIHPKDSCLILQPKDLPKKDDVFIHNSFRNFSLALNNFQNWPGILIWNKKAEVFVPLSKDREKGIEEITDIFNIIHYYDSRPYNNSIPIIKSIKTELNKNQSKYSYILHLSDLHFGIQAIDDRKDYLVQRIDDVNKKLDDGKIDLSIITGDLVDSPDDSFYQIFKSFRSNLREKINGEQVIVYGNHDLYRKGNRILTAEKQCLYSINDDDKIEILKDLKIIIIKIDSNAENSGVFAEGKVGQAQLEEIERELSKVENIEEYFLIAILHHHPIKMATPPWRKVNILKRLFPEWAENTIILKDAAELMKWVNERNIKLILHGHKHIPNVDNCNGTDIVACGSSTGNVTHREKDLTYLSFNLIKFDKNQNKAISCTTYYIDNLSMGLQHLNPVLLGEN